MNTELALTDLLARRTLDLVRIGSPSGSEDAIADHVLNFLSEHTRPRNLNRRGKAVTAVYGDGLPLVVLAGHLDTVSHRETPRSGIEGERLFGLGSSDMKGGLAVMMSLGETLSAAESVQLKGSLGLVFYDSEEVAYEQNGLRPLFDLEPWLVEADLALLMEPTNNILELGCLGTLHARVTFQGEAAHSARPWTGRNAIHMAVPFLTRLAELPEREYAEGDAVYREVVNVTLATGGTRKNVIPDRLELNVNLRFAPDRTSEDAEGFIRSLLSDEAAIEILDLAPAAKPRVDSPVLRVLVQDSNLQVRAKQAWTDVAQFSERGIPAANFGPGIPEMAHKQDEYVPVTNLGDSYRILLGFLGTE